MEDFAPSEATSPLNISHPHPGLEQGNVAGICWNYSTAVIMPCSGDFGPKQLCCLAAQNSLPNKKKSLSLGKYQRSQAKKGWRAVSHARCFWLLAC